MQVNDNAAEDQDPAKADFCLQNLMELLHEGIYWLLEDLAIILEEDLALANELEGVLPFLLGRRGVFYGPATIFHHIQ
jgi:hypothetical protein